MSENNENNTQDENQESQAPSAHTVDQVFEEHGQPQVHRTEEKENNTAMDTDEIIESLKNELAEKEDQLLRSIAETENVRKRARREADEARKYASAGLLQDLLNVLDDLNRALESAEQNQEGDGLLSGVQMVAAQLESILEKHHSQKIEALGKPFDPNLHEAIQMQPNAEVEASHVSMETRTGYQFHDRVLRTAQVIVSTGNPNTGNPNTGNPNTGNPNTGESQ